MKKVLLPICAAIIGYAAGMLRSPEPHDSVEVAPGLVSANPESEPEGNAAQAVSGFISQRDFRQFARIGAAMEKMSALQIGALLDRLSRLQSGDTDGLAPMILGEWTRRSPEDAFAWMEPKLAEFSRQRSFGTGFQDSNIALATAWAGADSARAMDFARSHHQTSLAAKLLQSAVFAMRDKSDAGRFELLREFPSGDARDQSLKSLCMNWSYKNPQAALMAAETLSPGAVRDELVAEVLVRVVGKDRKVAFEKLAALAPNDQKLELAVIQDFAKQSPAEAAAWVDAKDAEFGVAARAEIAARWAEKSPAEALNWALANGIPITKRPRDMVENGDSSVYKGHDLSAYDEPLLAAFNRSPAATLEWIKSLPLGDERDRYFSLLAERARSPKALAPLMAELPADTASKLAASITRSQPDAEAVEWAKSLSGEPRASAFRQLADRISDFSIVEPGPDRDAMLDGYAYRQARNAPVKALEAVTKISDPALRRQTFDDVMWSLTRGDIPFGKSAYSPGPGQSLRTEAREWLEKSTIPADWKERWKNTGL